MQDRRHISGVEEPLPEGENLLWEGRPALRSLLTHVFGARLILAYMMFLAALAVWAVATDRAIGGQLIILAAVAVVLQLMLVVFARMVVGATTYAITDRRIIIRRGIALPGVLNIPFSRVANLSWKKYRDGSGNIAVELAGGRIAYWLLWPHARPWRIFRAQPSMRALTDVETAAETLKSAFEAFQAADGVVSYQPGKAEFRMMEEDGSVMIGPRVPAPAVPGGDPA